MNVIAETTYGTTKYRLLSDNSVQRYINAFWGWVSEPVFVILPQKVQEEFGAIIENR